MEIITIDDYRDYAGLKQPGVTGELALQIKSANALITSAMGYSNAVTGNEDILYTKPARTKYFLSSPSASKITKATHETMGDITSSLNLRQGGVILAPRNLPAGDLVVEYEDGGMLTIPDDLKLAAILLVEHWNKKDYRESRTFGGETVQFNSRKSGIPEHIRTIIELYRRV